MDCVKRAIKQSRHCNNILGVVDKIKYRVLNKAAQGRICVTKEFLLKCVDIFLVSKEPFERIIFIVYQQTIVGLNNYSNNES